MQDTWRIAASGVVSLLLTLWLMPWAMMLAPRLGLVDQPGGRKIHQAPTPLVGGAVMFLTILAAALSFSLGAGPDAAVVSVMAVGDDSLTRGAAVLMGWAFPIALAIACLTGLVDDWLKGRHGELPVWAKLSGQMLAAGVLVWGGGVSIIYVSNPVGPGVIYLPAWLDVPLTLVWLVGMTNAVNFIDGLDGLAGGIVAVATFTLVVVALALNAVIPGIWVAAVLGACLAFLRFNFHPARVFMGDAGANFLGFLLAAIALLGYFKTATLAGLVVPVFSLSLPMLNGFFVVFRRLALGRPVHAADREHSFDILRRRGWNTVETVLIFLLLAMAMAAAGMGLALRPGALIP